MQFIEFKKTHWAAALLVLWLITGSAIAAPVITGGPVNAASYALNGLPNSGIARGGMFVVFGTGMGPGQLLQVSAFPIPTQLGGTSVTVVVGQTVVNCLMLYTLDRQIAAILPSSAPEGNGTLRVTFNGEVSNSVPIQVVNRSMGVFARNQAGMGPSIIQNFNSQNDQPINSILEAATPGQTVILWGTGLGPVSGNEAAGPLPGDNPNLPVDVFVGEQQATVTYRGRSGCCAGIDQIVFTVPPGVQGCYVSVAVRIGGVMSNYTSMAIAPQRGACSDPIHLNSADITRIQAGGNLNVAELQLFRIAAKVVTSGGALEGNLDFAEAGFGRVIASDMLASAGLQNLPSLGSCSTQQFQYEGFFDSVFSTRNPIPQQSIDAGQALTITGPLGVKPVPRSSPQSVGEYEAALGGLNPDDPSQSQPDFLVPGTYTISGPGSPAIGAFSAQITLPAIVAWTNRDTLPAVIPRDQHLTITWSGADSASEYVFLVGSSANPASGSGASFICVADASLGLFNVPARILSALPASGQSSEGPVGFLIVGKGPLRSVSSAVIPNVQIAYVYYFFGNLINTSYQ